MAGFFNPAAFAGPPAGGGLIPQCGACGLAAGCLSPKMPPSGGGRRGILIVAEAPGADEDKAGAQLVGKAGQELRKVLSEWADINLDMDCWKTNALICRPPDNRTPTANEVDYCRPNVYKAIKEYRPRVIVPLGAAAIRSVLGPLWREDPGGVGLWAGMQIPARRWNAWVCPTWHPSYILRSEKDRNYPALRLWWRRHLEGIAALPAGRPWACAGPGAGPPDYGARIRIELDPDAAAAKLRAWAADGGRVCWDYETNRLQPYYDDAEIVSCAVCWRGRETIAFPWAGAAVPAMRDLLVSPCPKVGANTKFEEVWTHEILGVWPENIVWDTMQNAHILDNRPGITGVKFQAFVRLGLEPWDAGVKPYLEDADSTGRNRVRELTCTEGGLRMLLKYNAYDALAEYEIARHQYEEWKNASENL